MKFFMDHKADPDWSVRRRIIILSLLWAAGLITYLGIWGRPVDLSETVASNMIYLFGAIIGSYVFGAVWDAKVKATAAIAQSAVDNSSDQTDATTTTTVTVQP